MDEVRPGTDDRDSEGVLGDVIVCPQVAATNAIAAGHTAVEEMLLLVVHGILHLLGFDHGEPAEEQRMFALQRKLLLTFLASRLA
jgi:probable rRNA maturation factor